VTILPSHLALHINNPEWLNECRPSTIALDVNADRCHKVCEYLPHLQAIRLAERWMSATEIVAGEVC